jgi:nitrogen fixation NifU-like protein
MFSPLALDHIQNRRNVGEVEGATHKGVAGVRGEGPFVELSFKVSNDRIEHCRYQTNGCPTSIASASIIASILVGRTISEALRVDEDDIRHLLGSLPEGKEDCPRRVVSAIQHALLPNQQRYD